MRRFKISLIHLLIFTGLLSTAVSQTKNEKYSGSRTYKLKSNFSSKVRTSKAEVPTASTVLSSRSLPSSSGGEDTTADFDQVEGQSEHNPISWGEAGDYRDSKSGDYRDSKSSYTSKSLPSVAPRYSSDSKYSNAASSSGLGVYSNSYPYGSYSNPQSYYSNPLLDSYPYYEKDRAARELASRVIPMPHTMATAASSLFGMSSGNHGHDSYEDSLALGGHHHHHEHDHGWGWNGHKEQKYKHIYVEKYDNNAIGLLGLLGVLSLLSNVLLFLTTTTTTTTTAAAGRKKRSIDSLNDETEESKRQRIFLDVLPYLAPVAHARNGQIPIDCTLQGICRTNKLLVTEYGYHGRGAGDRITSAIMQLFEEMNDDGKHKKQVVQAGRKGRNGRDCMKIYPKCKALHGPDQIPFVIGINDVPKLLAKVRHVAASTQLQL